MTISAAIQSRFSRFPAKLRCRLPAYKQIATHLPRALLRPTNEHVRHRSVLAIMALCISTSLDLGSVTAREHYGRVSWASPARSGKRHGYNWRQVRRERETQGADGVDIHPLSC